MSELVQSPLPAAIVNSADDRTKIALKPAPRSGAPAIADLHGSGPALYKETRPKTSNVGRFLHYKRREEIGAVMTDVVHFPRRQPLKSLEARILADAQKLVYFYTMARRAEMKRLSLGALIEASFERLHRLEELPAPSIFALQRKTEALLELMADPHSDPIGVIPRLTQTVLEDIMGIREN